MEYVIEKYSKLAKVKIFAILDSVYSQISRRLKANIYHHNGVGIDVIASIFGQIIKNSKRKYAVVSHEKLK